ncbi:MAG: PLP-dependent aspartate aminotransferase family protein [Megasphaera sp.]|jgi:cystathionine beta-lyase/cystathionine gamma-synthase|nr:PLP-dependent aspartate aminotransferase family protein [Megasphaera sp.]
MRFETDCIHGGYHPDSTGSVTTPIYLSTAFAHPGVKQSTGYDYIRSQNPTREQLEKTMALLEQGCDALAFSSGMAAISCVLELFKPGDHIIYSADLYGGSIRIFNEISQKNGLSFTALDTGDLHAVKEAIQKNTRAIYVETPSNPTMQITDIKSICELAHKYHILVIVDNTFLTPYFQKPLTLGADIVVHSGTKYLAGHNDVLAGFLVTAHKEQAERLHFLHKTIGACLSPFDCWVVSRGLKTLPLRMDRHAASALRIAKWLSKQPAIRKIYYPGIASSPRYEINTKQATGFGGMISFEVDTEETAVNLLQRVKLILFAESLGGTESLITYPLLQTHCDVPKEECFAKGINEKLLRLSVGLENVNDLIADLKQALA